MTPAQLDRLLALADAATPGPWPVRHRSGGTGPEDDERGGLGWEFGWSWDDPRADEEVGPPEPQLRGIFSRAADAAFIAAANPDTIRALVAAVREPLEVAEIERLRGIEVAAASLVAYDLEHPVSGGSGARIDVLRAALEPKP